MLDLIGGESSFRVILMFLGGVLVVFSVLRHIARRREFGASYTEHINKVKYKPLVESNEFGQKIKWIYEDNERSSEEPTGKA